SWGCAITAAYAVSLGAGTLLTTPFHLLMHRAADADHPPKDDAEKRAFRPGWSSIVTGVVERLVFTPVVTVAPAEAVTAMGAWLALKMAASWQRAPQGISEVPWSARAFLGLQTGLLSMAFAALGGATARYLMGLPVLPTP